MKTFRGSTTLFLRALVLMGILTASGIMFGQALSSAKEQAPKPSGTDPDGTVCHRRTLTLMLDPASLEYRRHKGHGDTDGACAPTNP